MLLVLVLLILFTLSITGEKTPLNNGIGYDGTFYYQVAQNFTTDFWTTGYDRFRIFRIFPFFLINLFFSFFDIEPTLANLMHSMYVLHFCNLAILLFFFFKLIKQCAWKPTTSALIFGCFFFNHFVLKNCGYEIFLTDAFANTIFLASYYYLLRQKYLQAIAISFLGILTWPTVAYIIWLLYIFKDPFPKNAPYLKLHTGKLLSITLPLLSVGAVATLYLLHKQQLLESMLFIQISKPLLFTSAIAWSAFLYIVLRNCDGHIYTPSTYAREFIRQSPWKKLALIAIPFIAINLYLRAHANDDFYFSEVAFILQVFLRPLKYPFITPVAHICYFGILPLLVIFLFRDFSKNIFNRSPGYALAFLAFILFAIDSEARHVIPLLPLILVPLGDTLDKTDLSAKTVAILLALQIALSHFYIPLNIEGFAYSLVINDYYGISQRYFMNQGPWVSFHSLALWTGISLVTGFLIYQIVQKRKF
ncbi:hypothetical protein [Fibrobacter sp.]|uniref:hypothetical protein n=1 Tax=Fibrobacter sp. TaxID=35828 RepID=UPI0038640C5D